MNATMTAVDSALQDYDGRGAMIYIIAVLLWYSAGIICMLGMQMRARSETIEESARRRTKLLIRNLRDHTNTKEILEELVDKEKRARLWDIYLGKTNHTKDKLTRDEPARIRHIEKQLATINRNRRLTNGTLFESGSEAHYFRSRSDSRQVTQTMTPVETPSTLRRRSSLDQQTLERWKALANQSKVHEQIPWAIRKLIIRRHFRRPTKKSLSIIQQEPASCSPQVGHPELLPSPTYRLTRHHSEMFIDLSPTHSERQNPYLTYFYTSSHRPSILASNFFSVSSEELVE